MQRTLEVVEPIARITGLDPRVALVFAGILAVLTIGTLWRLVAWRWAGDDRARRLLGRAGGWWVLTAAMLAVVALPWPAVPAALAVVSVLALREYRALALREAPGAMAARLLYVSIPVHYAAVWLGGWPAAMIVMPVVVLVGLALRLMIGGVARGFVDALARAYLGWMLTVYCLSYAALLVGAAANPVAGPAGWLVFFVVVVQFNDIAAAWWGRRIGGARLAPRLSPNKTWAGAAGGVVTATLLALVLAPLLTTLSIGGAVLSGLLLGGVGCASDLVISAVKRSAGADDSGTLLGEQGGMLDRVDSSIFTAPMFYFLIGLLG